MLAGILLVVLPTVIYGGLTLFTLLTKNLPGYPVITTIPCDTISGALGTRMPASIWSCP